MSDTPADDTPRKSPDSHKPAGESTGSYDEGAAPGKAASQEDQPTVISRTPVLKSPAKEGRKPQPSPPLSGPGSYEPGSRLGHFEIRDYIGGGGMGRVYRARDVTLGRSVAVKILTRDSVADKETVRRFLNEAQAAARLNHENIAQVYFVGNDDELPFIAFEYIEGVNIRAMVDRRGPLPLAEAVSFTLQVAQALAHAVERQVVHRDIKPSNVLITPEGQAKVIDMGLARLENPDDSGNDLTASGVTLGTFDYISPEQARDPRNADARSDTYSLGCTLFYMLAGRPPFPEGTVLQKLLQHQGDEPPDIRHFRPELPEEVSRVLRKMMAKDPRRRYQDSGRLIEALLSLADLAGILPHGPGRAVWVAPKQPTISVLQRHAPWMIPIAALVCIVVLLDIFWSGSNVPDHPAPPQVAMKPAGAESRVLGAGRSTAAPNGGQTPGTTPLQPKVTDAPAGDADQPALADTSQDTSTSSPVKPETPSSAADDPGRSPPEIPVVTAQVSRPHPLRAILAKYSNETALQQDELAAATTAAGRLSGGLTAASDYESVAADINAAEGIDGSPEKPPSSNDPLNPVANILVVDPTSENENAFASVGEAVEAARPNDVLELRFNGRREEKPLALANRKVTIRAGQDCSPILAFRPMEIDPLKYPRSMFNVTGGELTLIDVALELDVPRKIPADSWSLFKIGEGENLTLENCYLTIRNASDRQTAHHPEVAFFRLMPSAEIKIAVPDKPGENGRPRTASIQLRNCVARGEAVFVRAEEPQPVQLVWRNGLLVTTERFLVADGDERAPTQDEKIQITLQHVTAVVRSGLCRFVNTELTPRQLDADFDCSASIFVARNAPLIEQVGILDIEQSRGQIQWSGKDDFYHGFTYSRVLRPFDPMLEPEETPLDNLEQVIWRALPEASRPVNSTTPDDYALGGTATANPARSDNDEEQDAGFIVGDLPNLPTEPAAGEIETATRNSDAGKPSSQTGSSPEPLPDR